VSKVVLGSKGIVLAPGELSRAPGALTTATNVNVEAPGVIRSRQGHQRLTVGPGGPIWKTVSTKELNTSLLVNYGSTTQATALKYGDGVAAWSTVSGTFTNDPEKRMQVAVGRRNHYITSNEGVRRVESDFSAAIAGMPSGLAPDLTIAAAVLSGTGFLDDSESTSYRVTWCKKDAQGVIMEGPPSARVVVYNNTRTSGYASGVAKNVTLSVLLPKQTGTASTALTTSYFFRLYRSAEVEAGVVASDDMRLVYEAYLASGDITAGYVTVTDSTPDTVRELGPALYTNEGVGGDTDPSGLKGIQTANNPPPLARDVALFAGHMFYVDLQYPYSLTFTLLTTVAGTGLTAGDTLTIGGIVYTARAVGTAYANNEFLVYTVAGGNDQLEAMERTALSLCEAINKSTTNTTVWAHYAGSAETESVSGVMPGTIRLESRTGWTSFAAIASAHGTAFRPSLAATVNSTTDVYPNGFAYSKRNLPDAVPRVHFGTIGRDDTAILRSVVLGDALYLFTDAGVYVLTGRDSSNFAVNEFDLSFRLAGRELVTVCDDAIYAWGLEGIARITSSGVEIISNAIEPLVQDRIKTLGLTWLSTYGWATSYRTRHRVMFFAPDEATGDNPKNCKDALVYDTRMNAWTTWRFTAANGSGKDAGYATGAVRVSDDILYFGQHRNSGGDAYLYKERLAYAAADYKDDTLDTSNVGITKTVKWAAVATSPEMAAHWDELHLLYDVSATFTAWTTPTALVVSFTADLASGSGNVALAPTATSRMSRCLVPRAQRRSVRLEVRCDHDTAGEYFGLEGMALTHLDGEGTATVRT
jgi:hypothetical protein